MKIFRNPEFRREMAAYAALTILAVFVGLLIGPAAALLVFITGSLFCVLEYIYARKRYRRMEDLAGQIDGILHGSQRQGKEPFSAVLLSDSEEGELAILRSEIRKMTLRLSEQAEELLAEKRQLKEAIEDIFHQIRTPLTSMNLLASLLSAEDLPYERRCELTRELKTQLGRVQWLVETLLKLSKIEAGTAKFRKEEVLVRQILEGAVGPLLISMELREQAFVLRAADEKFLGDDKWTAEAFANIFKNCMEHTPPGGEICVTVSETALFTEIVVEDTGEGFSTEDLPHVFDRFYKGGNAAEGSIGIGLALSRSILAAQNGTLKAENRHQGGARFVARVYKGVV
ncbi:MAG: sensor histidine kinase [Lachnospiraceae bacterium]